MPLDGLASISHRSQNGALDSSCSSVAARSPALITTSAVRLLGLSHVPPRLFLPSFSLFFNFYPSFLLFACAVLSKWRRVARPDNVIAILAPSTLFTSSWCNTSDAWSLCTCAHRLSIPMNAENGPGTGSSFRGSLRYQCCDIFHGDVPVPRRSRPPPGPT